MYIDLSIYNCLYIHVCKNEDRLLRSSSLKLHNSELLIQKPPQTPKTSNPNPQPQSGSVGFGGSDALVQESFLALLKILSMASDSLLGIRTITRHQLLACVKTISVDTCSCHEP